MSKGENQYTEAIKTLAPELLQRAFGEAVSDKDVARLFTKIADFKENALLFGQASGSNDGNQLRSPAAFKQFQEKMRNENAQKSKNSVSDMILMLDSIDNALRDIQNGLAEKYGEDWAEKLAKKYLDEETYERFMAIDDPKERMHAIRHEIAKRFENGEIEIDEPEIKEWLDAYGNEIAGRHAEIEAVLNGEKQTSDVRNHFEAAVQTQDSEEVSNDIENYAATNETNDIEANSNDSISVDSFLNMS